MSTKRLFFAVLPFAFVCLAGTVQSRDVQLHSIGPNPSPVHQMITLKGEGFGAYDPAESRVYFKGEHGFVAGGTPYVWRDDFIQLPLPPRTRNVTATGELTAVVRCSSGVSNERSFEAALVSGTAPVTFSENTSLADNHFDISGFLGLSADNMARTKDAHVGDVNGDGLPDLIDNNSNNEGNGTHAILHLNQNGQGFDSNWWEPLSSTDTGTFMVTVPNGGDFVGDAICYDADLVDLNNDELMDWVQAAAGTNTRVRVIMNNDGGVSGAFMEATSTWIGSQNPPGSPDDICSGDVNGDGFVDIAAAYRFSDSIDVFLNQAGSSFAAPITVQATGSASIHDVFYLDANIDGFLDLCLVNESGQTQIFTHDGNLANPSWTFFLQVNTSAFAGVATDFNNDGRDDFALAGSGIVRAFINRPNNPGTFAVVDMPDVPGGTLYDVEAGDIDNDGFVDLLAASITTFAEDTIGVWKNNGNLSFTNLTSPGATALLPNAGPYQRLSTDLIDYDVDGDLDLYVTGADGSGAPGQGFGMVANQFWENEMINLPLTMHANPKSVPGGDTLSTLTFDGAPGEGVLIALVDVEGSPFFFKLDIGTFDGNGDHIFNVVAPVGFAGTEITLMGFGVASSGGFVATNPQLVTLQ